MQGATQNGNYLALAWMERESRGGILCVTLELGQAILRKGEPAQLLEVVGEKCSIKACVCAFEEGILDYGVRVIEVLRQDALRLGGTRCGIFENAAFVAEGVE